MNDLQLRPAQEKILEYENGRLAISAVPESGKTLTLSLVVARLECEEKLNQHHLATILN